MTLEKLINSDSCISIFLFNVSDWIYTETPNNFASIITSNYFKRLKISSDFITCDPEKWISLRDY